MGTKVNVRAGKSTFWTTPTAAWRGVKNSCGSWDMSILVSGDQKNNDFCEETRADYLCCQQLPQDDCETEHVSFVIVGFVLYHLQKLI